MCANLFNFNISEYIENRHCFAHVINCINIMCLYDADNLMKEKSEKNLSLPI